MMERGSCALFLCLMLIVIASAVIAAVAAPAAATASRSGDATALAMPLSRGWRGGGDEYEYEPDCSEYCDTVLLLDARRKHFPVGDDGRTKECLCRSTSTAATTEGDVGASSTGSVGLRGKNNGGGVPLRSLRSSKSARKSRSGGKGNKGGRSGKSSKAGRGNKSDRSSKSSKCSRGSNRGRKGEKRGRPTPSAPGSPAKASHIISSLTLAPSDPVTDCTPNSDTLTDPLSSPSLAPSYQTTANPSALSTVSKRFDISDCDSYRLEWLVDLAETCGDLSHFEQCECTAAEVLLEKGEIVCPDAADSSSTTPCPDHCSVCQACLKLIGCTSM